MEGQLEGKRLLLEGVDGSRKVAGVRKTQSGKEHEIEK